MKKITFVLPIILTITQTLSAQPLSDLALSVSPAFRWMTEAQPYGDIQLTNNGTVASEITIVTSGLPAIDSLSTPPSTIGDLSPHLTVFPPRVILEPGETKIVRYAIMDTTPIPDGGHTALVKARLARRTPIDQIQSPTSAASLRINYEMVVPLILIKGSGAPEIHVISTTKEPGMISLNLTNHGNSPWSGTVHLLSEDGRTSFGSKTTTVFHQREIEVELDAELPPTFQVSFEPAEEWVPVHSIQNPPALLVSR